MYTAGEGVEACVIVRGGCVYMVQHMSKDSNVPDAT